MTTIRTQH